MDTQTERINGDEMLGSLNINGHLVYGVSIDYPQDYNGGEAVSWNKSEPKPVVTVWTEEKGDFERGAFEWSFGNGSDGRQHSMSGYIMMAPGRIIHAGSTSKLNTISHLVYAASKDSHISDDEFKLIMNEVERHNN